MALDRKFLIAVVVLFVASMLIGYVVHGVLLHADYLQLPNIMRAKEEAAGQMGYMLFAHVLIAVGFTWIYKHGREEKPWLAQGIRFGIAVAVLAVIPWYLIYHAVAQFPLALALKQSVFDTLGTILMGIVVAFIYK